MRIVIRILQSIMQLADTAILFWLTLGLPVIARHYYHLGYNWLAWGVAVPMGCMVVNTMLINFFGQILSFFKDGRCLEKIKRKKEKALGNSLKIQVVFMSLTWVVWLGYKFFN